MKIYERMFQIMEQKNIKAVQLADKLGISKGVISNWKKRKTNPPIEYTVLICELLEVSIEYLITGEENNKNLDLNENEQEMLEKFNQLPEREQIKIIGIVEERLEKYNEKEQNSLTSKIG